MAIQDRRHLDETPTRELSLAWLVSLALHLGVIALVWLFPNPSVIAPALLSKEVFLMRAEPQLAPPTAEKPEQIKPTTPEATIPTAQPKQSIKLPIKQPDISISPPPQKKRITPPVKQQEPPTPPKKSTPVEEVKPAESIEPETSKPANLTDNKTTETTSQSKASSADSPKLPTYTEARIDAKYANDNPQPQYPPMARRLGQEGIVKLKVTVNSDGFAQEVNIEESSGYPLLDKAAQDAISKWRFVPATRDGEPITQALRTQWVYKLTNR